MTYREKVENTFRNVSSVLIEASGTLLFDELYLFGSAARGQLKLGSDLDFLVIVNDPSIRKKVSQAIELLDLREDVGDVPVDIIVRTRAYIESGYDLFSREVLRDRKLLWRRGDNYV